MYFVNTGIDVSDGLPKKVWIGEWVCGVSPIKFLCVDFWNCFNFAKPLRMCDLNMLCLQDPEGGCLVI